MNSKVLLYSTRDYIQYPVINHNGKEYEEEYIYIYIMYMYNWASLVAQMVKHWPIMREPRVQSLGWGDLLEKEMAPHCSIFAWKIPWTEELGRLQSMGSQRIRHD